MKKKLLALCLLGILKISVLADGDTPISGYTDPPPPPPEETPIVQVVLNYLGL